MQCIWVPNTDCILVNMHGRLKQIINIKKKKLSNRAFPSPAFAWSKAVDRTQAIKNWKWAKSRWGPSTQIYFCVAACMICTHEIKLMNIASFWLLMHKSFSSTVVWIFSWPLQGARHLVPFSSQDPGQQRRTGHQGGSLLYRQWKSEGTEESLDQECIRTGD